MTARRFPVEAGHILMFARAIGDENPVYQGAITGVRLDLPAPPTFVQSSAQFDPDYVLRPRSTEPWFGSGRSNGFAPSGGGVLHAEQHFIYHQSLRAGVVLTATVHEGESWEKVGRSGGKLDFTEKITEYRDEHGSLVVTARAVGARTERVASRKGSQL